MNGRWWRRLAAIVAGNAAALLGMDALAQIMQQQHCEPVVTR